MTSHGATTKADTMPTKLKRNEASRIRDILVAVDSGYTDIPPDQVETLRRALIDYGTNTATPAAIAAIKIMQRWYQHATAWTASRQ